MRRPQHWRHRKFHVDSPPRCAATARPARRLLLQHALADDASFSSKFVGFDTGPGNVLMDLWVARHWNRAYDDNGALAAKGCVIQGLLDRMLQHEYFARPAPKSTGRDLFNEAWLNLQLSSFEAAALTGPSAALNDCELAQQQQLDVLATLLALTAHSIALHMQHARFTVTQVTAIFSIAHAHACCNAALPLTRVPQVIVCGGGVRNAALMQQLQQLCRCPVMSCPFIIICV
jgi:1,6-anhydro-N-acetylmuramate kinase